MGAFGKEAIKLCKFLAEFWDESSVTSKNLSKAISWDYSKY
jgi:hypothetical protein